MLRDYNFPPTPLDCFGLSFGIIGVVLMLFHSMIWPVKIMGRG
jgi:hypothetical protein